MPTTGMPRAGGRVTAADETQGKEGTYACAPTTHTHTHTHGPTCTHLLLHTNSHGSTHAPMCTPAPHTCICTGTQDRHTCSPTTVRTGAHSHTCSHTHAHLHKLGPTLLCMDTHMFFRAHTLSRTGTHPTLHVGSLAHRCVHSHAAGPWLLQRPQEQRNRVVFPNTCSHDKANRKGLGARAGRGSGLSAGSRVDTGPAWRDAGRQTDAAGWEVEGPPRHLGPAVHPHPSPRRAHPSALQVRRRGASLITVTEEGCWRCTRTHLTPHSSGPGPAAPRAILWTHLCQGAQSHTPDWPQAQEQDSVGSPCQSPAQGQLHRRCSYTLYRRGNRSTERARHLPTGHQQGGAGPALA